MMAIFGWIFVLSTNTRWCLPFLFSHPNHFKKNIPCTLARRICTIVENRQQKLIHLSELKENLKKYDYPVNIISGIKKALKIPQNDLRKPKEKQTDEVLPSISTFNRNNPPVYNPTKNSIEVLKRSNAPEFESIKLINSKRQPSNLKKLPTKAEFSNEEVGFKSAKICDANIASHCYYPQNIHLKM